MIFMPRGEPTEKLKKEEDIARIEKDRLERLERERLERMRGDVDEETFQDQQQQRPSYRSADDLDDGYLLEPVLDAPEEDQKVISYSINPDDEGAGEERYEYEYEGEGHAKSSGVAKIAEEPSEDEESGSDEEESEEEESDADSLEDLKADDSEDEQEVEPPPPVKVLKISTDDEDVKQVTKPIEKVQPESSLSKKHQEALEKVPYTIEMPSSYEHMAELLDHQPVKIQGIIIDRIIKTNHLRLLQLNRLKMIKLFAYLLQYLNDKFASTSEESVSKHFKLLQVLTPLLYDLIQMNPEDASKCFLEVVKEKYEDYKKSQKKYPKLDTLIFFKLLGSLFPTSDFRHPIVTPANVFLHHILSQAKVRTRSDIASGLFLVTLVLENQQLSKKFLPSVMNFLNGVCYLGIEKVELMKPVPPFKADDSFLALEQKFKGEFETSMKLESEDFLNSTIDEDFKVRALNVAVHMMSDFIKLYDELVGMKYFLDPFETILARLKDEKKLPKTLREDISGILGDFKNIRMDKKFEFPEPVKKIQPMIRLLEPRFETVLSDRRQMYSRAEGAKLEQQKLKHMVKREFKSAKRELRRDNEFLSKIKHQRRQATDTERKAKVKRIFNEASVQQSEFNALSRSKGRKGKF